MELVIPIPFFLPRVSVVVVASRFPEARLIFFHEANAAHPLGAFPKIEMRNHHARRSTVFWRERLIVIFQGDEGLSVDDFVEGNVGGITAVTISRDECSFVIDFGVLKENI